MRLSRHQRVRVSLLALLGLLFMQVSLAAYACSLPSSAPVSMIAGNGDAVDCDEMDREQMALCHAHCHPPQTASADVSPPPQAVVPALDLVATAVLEQSLLPHVEVARVALALPVPGAAPPIPLRNCCLRN
jgi:hypothetical protein